MICCLYYCLGLRGRISRSRFLHDAHPYMYGLWFGILDSIHVRVYQYSYYLHIITREFRVLYFFFFFRNPNLRSSFRTTSCSLLKSVCLCSLMVLVPILVWYILSLFLYHHRSLWCVSCNALAWSAQVLLQYTWRLCLFLNSVPHHLHSTSILYHHHVQVIRFYG